MTGSSVGPSNKWHTIFIKPQFTFLIPALIGFAAKYNVGTPKRPFQNPFIILRN